MNIKIVNNKYLNALLLLILFSAIIHMIILIGFAIISKDIYVLNYFNILDLDLLYSSGLNTVAGNIFSVFAVITIYVMILKSNDSDNEHGVP